MKRQYKLNNIEDSRTGEVQGGFGRCTKWFNPARIALYPASHLILEFLGVRLRTPVSALPPFGCRLWLSLFSSIPFGRPQSPGFLFALMPWGHTPLGSLQHPSVPRYPVSPLRCELPYTPVYPQTSEGHFGFHFFSAFSSGFSSKSVVKLKQAT